MSKTAAIFAAIAIAAISGYYAALRSGAAAIADYDRKSLSVRETLRVLDTAYVRDTIVMSRNVTRYVESRTTDTIMRRDTVYVRRDLADSAIASCQAVVLTCEARVQALSHALAIAESTIHSSPTPVRRKTSLTAIVSAAAVGAVVLSAVVR